MRHEGEVRSVHFRSSQFKGDVAVRVKRPITVLRWVSATSGTRLSFCLSVYYGYIEMCKCYVWNPSVILFILLLWVY